MELKELTKLLCNTPGPTGFEDVVRNIAKDYLTPFADEISTDALGNLMAVKKSGIPGAKRVMLNAHMDEIGLIVTGQKNGFLSFSALGGVDPRMLPAREVRICGRKPLFGVIDTLPPHLTDGQDIEKAIEADKLYIDAGLTEEEANELVPSGTPVVFSATCESVGESFLCGKALDDRSCVAIILKAFELLSARDLGVDLMCLVSTQEEVGHRGAFTGAWTMHPDYAIVVDVTHGKTPDAPDVKTLCGSGAVIEYGPNMNRALTEQLLSIAKEKDIPYQIGVSAGGNSGTDAHAIQISRQGVATALISLPLKYMHTPVEMVDTKDMAAIERLICEYILTAGEVDDNA